MVVYFKRFLPTQQYAVKYHWFWFEFISMNKKKNELLLTLVVTFAFLKFFLYMQANEGTSSVVVASPTTKLTVEPPGKPVSSSSCSLRKSCRRLSRQIFEKYLNFLRPFCRRIQRVGGNGNGGSRSPIITREAHQCCDDEWRRRSCDSETSIYDAVLHCKKSIGTCVWSLISSSFSTSFNFWVYWWF